MDNDGSSSIYSRDSTMTPVSRVAQIGTHSSSRSNSYTPSYMSSVQARSSSSPHNRNTTESYRYHERVPSQIALKIPRRPVSTPTKAPSPIRKPEDVPGLLLVVFAAAPHPSTTSFLETLLARRSFSGIAVVGPESQEIAIKQLKMDIYALVGRMHKEIGVYTYLRDICTEEAMGNIVPETIRASSAPGLHGIICCPEFGDSAGNEFDVLGASETDLQQSWRRSVVFLHAASKASIAGLQDKAAKSATSTNRGPLPATQTPFFLVADSPAFTTLGQITKPACDTLIDLLQKNAQPKGVTVGFAEHLLIPERPESQRSETSQQTGGSAFPHTGIPAAPDDHTAFTPSESPTKLWNMWALQNGD